jgi:hypothetical protein
MELGYSIDSISSAKRTLLPSRSPSISTALASGAEVDVYNGVLDADEYGFIFCRNVRTAFRFNCSATRH